MPVVRVLPLKILDDIQVNFNGRRDFLVQKMSMSGWVAKARLLPAKTGLFNALAPTRTIKISTRSIF